MIGAELVSEGGFDGGCGEEEEAAPRQEDGVEVDSAPDLDAVL